MKVLISRPDKIGDVVLTLHGVKQLKRLMPHMQVYMHVADYTYDLVSNVSFVDGCVRFGEDLEPYGFDAVVDLMAKYRTAKSYLSPRIKIRIGNSARWFCFLYNRRKLIRRSHALINEAEYNWQLISLLDSSFKNSILKDSLLLSDFKDIQEFAELKDYYILMPGITASAEAWPHKRWRELAQLLAADKDQNVLILFGPAEEAMRAKFKDIAQAHSNIHLKYCTELKEVLGVLKNAKGYVGTSTGITHLASVAKLKGVAIYPVARSMHPRRWQPFHSTLNVVSPGKTYTAQDILNKLDHTIDEQKNQEIKLSAFVICKNEEKNIRRCLESIKWCDELLVVDSGSTDATVDICKEYTSRIIERDWPGYKEQKQFALEQCQGQWVLNIDSDEEVSPELRGRIQKIMELPPAKRNRVNGYFISRTVYFLDKWWDRGGWFPEYRMRFFQKEFTHWGGINPHEKAIVAGPTRKLPGSIYHYTYNNLTELIDKHNTFSEKSSLALYKQGYRSSFVKIFFHPILRFLKFYFVKLGFREGKLGFVVALCEACYTFLKYAKLWELDYLEKKAHNNPSNSKKNNEIA